MVLLATTATTATATATATAIKKVNEDHECSHREHGEKMKSNVVGMPTIGNTNKMLPNKAVHAENNIVPTTTLPALCWEPPCQEESCDGRGGCATSCPPELEVARSEKRRKHASGFRGGKTSRLLVRQHQLLLSHRFLWLCRDSTLCKNNRW